MTRHFNIPGTAFLLLLVGIWEAASRAIDSPSFPGVGTVLAALYEDLHTLALQMGVSIARAAAGFALALAVMLPLGIFIGRTPRIARYVEPLIDLLRPLPPLAIVPVAMLFAGTGSLAKILVVFYSASFPLIINTIDATRATHPLLVHVGRSLGLTRAEIMRQIDLPAALPQIMAGVRLSLALAVLVSVSSEMLLSTDGVGNYLMRAQEQFRIAHGLAAISVIAFVSLAINTVVQRIERRLLAWHHARHGLPP